MVAVEFKDFEHDEPAQICKFACVLCVPCLVCVFCVCRWAVRVTMRVEVPSMLKFLFGQDLIFLSKCAR